MSTDKGFAGHSTPICCAWRRSINPATTQFSPSGAARNRGSLRVTPASCRRFPVPRDSTRFVETKPIATFARDLFLRGEVDKVTDYLTNFINTLTQRTILPIESLPIGRDQEPKHSGCALGSGLAANTRTYLFEPSPEARPQRYLFRHYLNIQVYRVLLDAKASEQSARMVAMKSATDNAQSLSRS